MYSKIPKLALALGVALTLGACASLPDVPSRDRVAQIHPGLTHDEVRSIAGAPGNVTGDARAADDLWIYTFTDDWGYRSEFDVTFGANGLVTDTYSERLDY